jgi:hypothetical protein
VKARNRTIEDDLIRFQRHSAPVLGTKTIPELTVQDIDKLHAKLEKEGKAPQTVKHSLTLVKRLLNFALHKGHVEYLPGVLHISMPTVDNRVAENLMGASKNLQWVLKSLFTPLRHARARGHPERLLEAHRLYWIPAFAGMTWERLSEAPYIRKLAGPTPIFKP